MAIPPGFGNGNPTSIFFNQSTQSWGSPISINGSVNSESPLYVGSSPNGFIATWTVDYDSVYANVSTDGVTWQPSSVQIGGSGYNLSAVTGCGNNELFLVVWNDPITNTIYVATSGNNGSTWNGPFAAVTGVVNPLNENVGCFGNAQGFLLSLREWVW